MPSQSEQQPEARALLWRPVLGRIMRALAPLSFLILLCIVLTYVAPNFATRDNIKQIAVQSAVVAILACGQTAVIIAAEIDLSVGSTMALSGVVAAEAMSHHGASVWQGVLLACVCGLASGAFTGTVAAVGRIPSFIVTLGMMGILHGAAGIVSHSVNIGGLPTGFQVFGYGELFGSATTDGIPYAVIIMVVVAVLMYIGLSRTRWGRAIYAMGGNREASRLSGVPLFRRTVSVFALSGLLAGVASILNVSRASVASKDAGVGYELDAIAATVVGGTSLFGGRGGIPGTIIGAVLIFTIRNGCALRGLGPDFQMAIIGFVVILAVLFDRWGLKNKG